MSMKLLDHENGHIDREEKFKKDKKIITSIHYNMGKYTGFTPCPEKQEASSFSTVSLAFLDRFL